jgi:hypothetical protein
MGTQVAHQRASPPFGTHFRPARQFYEADPEQIFGVLCPRAGVAAAAFTQTLGLTVVQDAGVWLTIQRMP